ncbi:MAG TPA: hypothetical protein VHX64_17695 [Caulobacteraceae bacterium]|nr:hypothetical protein [Caulobacteraceae bacterium]
MTKYRIVLLNDAGEEVSSGYMFAGDDGSACGSAERLMQSTANAASVRVLDGDRLVCSYERAA